MTLSGVHFIMIVKSAQPGEDGGCRPSSLHSIYHHKQSYGVRSSLEVRYTSPFLLYAHVYSEYIENCGGSFRRAL